jgi:hypothetical protein
MNLLSKEYRAVLWALVFALLIVGGSTAFVWTALQERNAAVAELEMGGKDYERHRLVSPAPTEGSRRQLEQQEQDARAAANKLLAAIDAMNIPLEKIQPQDFQSALNSKTQSFTARAAKSRVTIPRGVRESEPFSLDFDEFIKKVPSEERAPLVNRQLIAADRLLNTLLDSKPIALVSFKIERKEEPKDPPREAKETKADAKSGKAVQAPPTVRVLATQGFDLKFTATPDSFRDFLNALTRDKKAFFVVRRLRVTTLSKEGVPMLAPSKSIVAATVEPPTTGQTPAASAVAQYILGDEHVEVEMRVDLLTSLLAEVPPLSKPGSPSQDKTAKPPSKEGAKQP